MSQQPNILEHHTVNIEELGISSDQVNQQLVQNEQQIPEGVIVELNNMLQSTLSKNIVKMINSESLVTDIESQTQRQSNRDEQEQCIEQKKILNNSHSVSETHFDNTLISDKQNSLRVDKKLFDQSNDKQIPIISEINSELPTCRICLESEVTQESGPMHTPCNCKGSLIFIHQQCMWLDIESSVIKHQKQVSQKDEEQNDEKIEESICTVCKTPFRVGIELKKKRCSNLEWFHNLKRVKLQIILSLVVFIAFTSISYFLIRNSYNFTNYQESQIVEQMISFFTIPVSFVSLGYLVHFLLSSRFKKVLEITKIFTDIESYTSYRQSLNKTQATDY